MSEKKAKAKKTPLQIQTAKNSAEVRANKFLNPLKH